MAALKAKRVSNLRVVDKLDVLIAEHELRLAVLTKADKDNIDGECITCKSIDHMGRVCSESQRPCGHHCNHIWTHAWCDWCGHQS